MNPYESPKTDCITSKPATGIKNPFDWWDVLLLIPANIFIVCVWFYIFIYLNTNIFEIFLGVVTLVFSGLYLVSSALIGIFFLLLKFNRPTKLADYDYPQTTSSKNGQDTPQDKDNHYPVYFGLTPR